jgi:hypothetical protein
LKNAKITGDGGRKMVKKIRFYVLISVIALLSVSIAACSAKKGDTDTAQKADVSTTQKVDTKASEEPQATAAKENDASSNLKQPISTNDTGKTLIQRVSTDKNMNTSFMITSKSGAVVVVDPYLMPSKTVKTLMQSAIHILILIIWMSCSMANSSAGYLLQKQKASMLRTYP